MAELIPQTTSNLGGTLTGVANLANLFLPQNTNTTGSQTTQDNRSSTQTQTGGTTTTTTSQSVAPGQVDAVVKSILEGTNGLAAVSSGQRTAGLYGSSTNQLLTNDLVARAAAEAAKLNQSTTQTTVRPDQVTTTQNAGGQTTNSTQAVNKQAPVSGGTLKGVGGVLGALQLMPKDVKDAVISGLGFGKKAVASAANNSLADNMRNSDSSTSDYGANVAANEASLGGVGTAGQGGQTVAGVGTTDIADQYLGTSAGAGVDLSAGADQDVGGYSLSGVNNAIDSGSDLGGQVADTISGGLGDVGDALGGFISGVGDTASDIGSSVGSWFDDFDFSFADGGAVSIDGIKQKMHEHVVSKLADGGGIGSVGDGRYGAPAGNRATTQGVQRGNVFEDTNRNRAVNAGLQSGDIDTLQTGFVPRTTQERQSVFSLIDTIPQLLNALLGSDSSNASGKADGGEVSRPFKKPAGYANGGTVTRVKRMANGGLASPTNAENNNVYDLSDVSYLANTGLTAKGPDLVRALGASSNDQVVNSMVQDNIRPTNQSDSVNDVDNAGLRANASSSRRIVAPREANPVNIDTGSGAGVSVGEGIGSVGGIGAAVGNAVGIGTTGGNAAVNAAVSGISGIAGIATPGLAGLANAQDNQAAVNAAISGVIGMANPVAGLVAAIALSMGGGVGNGGIGAGIGTSGTTSGVSPNANNNDPGLSGMNPNAAPPAEASVTANNAGIGNVGLDGAPDQGSQGDSSGIGGVSAGNSTADGDDGGNASAGTGVGASGDSGGDSGGDGGYADGGSPGISVAQARANPATTADKIPAMLSEGEYVLPADVTAALGIPFLDSVKAALHVPADVQRNSGFRAPARR